MSGGLRVVLDTNVLISGLVYPKGTPGKIVSAMRGGGLEVVASRYIFDELARVLPTMRQLAMDEDEILRLIVILKTTAQLVEPGGFHDAELRDPADNEILGTLVASGAEYFVTGDKDLLVLAGRYPVVTPAEFWARHG